MTQDRVLKVAQAGSWFDTSVGDEDAPGLLVRLMRVGLAAAVTQREHQLRRQTLTESGRMPVDTKDGTEIGFWSEP